MRNAFRQLKKYREEQFILVFQYGKSGSTTLANSINGALHAHDFYGTLMCAPAFKLRYGAIYRHVFFKLDRFIRRMLLHSRGEVKIIVPLRNPADRNISMFFQDLPFWYVEYFKKFGRSDDKAEGLSILKTIFLSEFPHGACDEWFQNEFTRLTNIHLDEIHFDKLRGIGYAHKGKFKCFFIHYNLISTEPGQAALSDFLGSDLSISSSNRGSKKWYADSYLKFIADADFVQSYRQRLSNSTLNNVFFDKVIDEVITIR